MECNEIEVKFYIKNPRQIKRRIHRITPSSFGRYFETNVRYENREHNLTNKNLLVRLRKSKEVFLTIKQFPKINSTEFKINRELEVTISNFETMNHILEILGYHKEQLYEKWREEWKTGETTLCLDTMPYGCFLEIEGQPKGIKAMASKLGLKWDKRITLSYLKIFEIIKREGNLNFNDLKFERFHNPKHFEQYRTLFENGKLE